ncbi:MAG: hypothetical protein P8176_01455 [Gammaproteobacteria bacterium]
MKWLNTFNKSDGVESNETPPSPPPSSIEPTEPTEPKPVSGVTPSLDKSTTAPSMPNTSAPTPPTDTAITTKKWRHLAALAIINVCVFLAYQGFFDHIAHSLGSRHIDRINQHYLTQASHDADALIELLSTSKMVLAILQSSSGGIDFIVDVEVKIGQALHVLYDTVDRAWQCAFIVMAAVELLKLLLQLAPLITAPVWTLLFIFLGMTVALRPALPGVSKRLQKLAQSTLLIAMAIHLFLPASVAGAAMLNKHFFATQRTHVYQQFHDVTAKLPRYDTQTKIKDNIKTSVTQVHDQSTTLHQHSLSLARLTTQHAIFSLLEYLLSPLLILGGLYQLVARLLR